MTISINNIAESILSNSIDKQEALRSFENLSESEKNQLISALKFKLSGNDEKSGQISDGKIIKRLKVVDERNLNADHLEYIKKLSQEFEAFAPKSKANALKHQ